MEVENVRKIVSIPSLMGRLLGLLIGAIWTGGPNGLNTLADGQAPRIIRGWLESGEEKRLNTLADGQAPRI